jgi:MFS family permease
LYETGPFFLLGVHYPPFTLGCLLVRTGNELIAFHALQGIAMALATATAVGLITSNFPTGRGRNIAFALPGRRITNRLRFRFGA